MSCSCKECENLCSHTETRVGMEVSYSHHSLPAFRDTLEAMAVCDRLFLKGKKKSPFFCLEVKWHLRK